MKNEIEKAIETLHVLKDNAARQNQRWYAERAFVAIGHLKNYLAYNHTKAEPDPEPAPKKVQAKKVKAKT